jgi:hypothetical protein
VALGLFFALIGLAGLVAGHGLYALGIAIFCLFVGGSVSVSFAVERWVRIEGGTLFAETRLLGLTVTSKPYPLANASRIDCERHEPDEGGVTHALALVFDDGRSVTLSGSQESDQPPKEMVEAARRLRAYIWPGSD